MTIYEITMPISIDQWCAAIGLFRVCRYVAIMKKKSFESFNHPVFLQLYIFPIFFFLLLVQHGDIEINPGCKKMQPNIFHVVPGMSAIY